MLLIYLPQLIHVVQYLSSPLLDAKYVLMPSLRLFHELFARWGAGRGPISLAYDAAFLLGLVFLLANLLRGLRGGSRESFQQRERCELAALVSLACFAAPFLLFSLVPFSKFFDIRFLMQAYPAFVMVAAHGLVRSSDLFGDRVHVRWLRATSRGRMLLILVTGIAVPNLAAYAAFRQTRYRCSDYFRAPRLLSAYDGFCVRHILLSTNIATDKFLVRSLDGPSRGRVSPGSVPRVGGPQRRSSD